ncbi:MAG TPA: PAS domain-containing protein [Flavipsychrobacter sp.]|jgi:PAS domain S-box-containing protein|nr:PAS domain-containing protein [Flavipsychrobacter sp.]
MNTLGFFQQIFNHSKTVAFILMNEDGIILDSNLTFTTSFGYEKEDAVNKYFRFLFTKEDQDIGKPEVELEICKTKGAAKDENYLMHKNDRKIWTSGETVKVVGEDGSVYLVKIVHANHAKKVLEKYVAESNEFIEALFDSVQDKGVLMIDSRMKVIRYNKTFCSLFKLQDTEVENRRLTDLHIPFIETLKENIRKIFLTGEKVSFKDLTVSNNSGGETVLLSVTEKLIEVDGEKKLLMVFTPE